MNSFIPWVLIYLILSKETVWYGNCQRRGILTSARSMISFEVPCLLSFLGKVFGRLSLLRTSLSLFGLQLGKRLSLLRTSLSLFGLQLGKRFLQGIFYGVEASILLIGALCAAVMERRWIICFFIAEKLFSCGAWFLDLLGFLGFCQDRLQIHSSVGEIGLESTLLEFGT